MCKANISIDAMFLRSHPTKISQCSQNIYELMLGLQNIAELANSVCKAQLNRKTNRKHGLKSIFMMYRAI